MIGYADCPYSCIKIERIVHLHCFSVTDRASSEYIQGTADGGIETPSADTVYQLKIVKIAHPSGIGGGNRGTSGQFFYEFLFNIKLFKNIILEIIHFKLSNLKIT